jgi:hypothetical protein
MRLPDDGPGLPWDDSLSWYSGLNPATLSGIVMDCAQAQAVGTWTNSSYTRPFVGNGYLHDGNNEKGAKSLRFRFNVPRAGQYELRLAYSAFDNRATDVPITINTPDGIHRVRVNQRLEPPLDKLFCSLGTYALQKGWRIEVVISNEATDGYVSADAVQLIQK